MPVLQPKSKDSLALVDDESGKHIGDVLIEALIDAQAGCTAEYVAGIFNADRNLPEMMKQALAPGVSEGDSSR